MDAVRQAMFAAGFTSRICAGTGKRRQASEDEALAEIARIRRRGIDRNPRAPLNAWPCPHCGDWHIGHRVGTMAEALSDMRRAHTPAGYTSNAAAVADIGKYYVKGDQAMATAAQQSMQQVELNAAVAKARKNGKQVYVYGAPRGTFADWIHRHDEIEHVISTEAKPGDAAARLYADCGVVLLTRFASVALTKALREDAKQKGIPCFGVYQSATAVNRALAEAMQINALSIAPSMADFGSQHTDAAVAESPATLKADLHDVVGRGEIVVQQPATTETVVSKREQEIHEWFAEVRGQMNGFLQAMDVLETVAVDAVREADEAKAELESLQGAAGKLKALQSMLKDIAG